VVVHDFFHGAFKLLLAQAGEVTEESGLNDGLSRPAGIPVCGRQLGMNGVSQGKW